MRTLPVLLLLAVGPLHYRVVTDCEGSPGSPRDDAGSDAGADAGLPAITSAIINGGAALTNASLLKLSVRASGEHAPLSVRVAPADGVGNCQARYADDDWRPYDGGTLDVDVWFQPTDGQKKLCAWVKDANASVSVIQPPTGTEGVDMDTLQLDTVSIPVVSSFTVTTAGGGTTFTIGQTVVISFTITDAQALAQAPLELWYSTSSSAEEDWIPFALGVGASGGTTSYTGSYTSFTAPTAGPFRVMLKAVDAAGNRSAAAVSDLLNGDLPNGGKWSVYAGSRDLGAGAGPFTTTLPDVGNTSGSFAVDPRTHDVYFHGEEGGILRLNARTGLVERVFWDGAINLPDDGPLPARPSFTGYVMLDFDPAGRLYLLEKDWEDLGRQRTIYQLDLTTRWCRRYAGPGTVFDDTATPQTVFISETTFDVDEDGTLFFFTNCSPGVNDETSGKRLMKITQNPDGTAGTVSVVAGNCVFADPPTRGPMDAVSVPLGAFPYSEISSLTAFEHGRYIYFAGYGFNGAWKVLDGQLYGSNISVGNGVNGLVYNPVDARIYASNGGVKAYIPNLTGPDGDVAVSTYAEGGIAGSPGCWEDGVVATQACVNAHFTSRMDSDGTVLFMDGQHLNGRSSHLIRYVDSAGLLRTRLGARPFSASGVDRRLVRSHFAGIVYKPSNSPNQAAFPEGLYFADPQGMVLGHIDPATNRAVVDWGDQSGNDVPLPTGTPISSGLSLGVDYSGGNVRALAFDDNGLPWLRVQPVEYGPTSLFRVDAARKLVALQTGQDYWELAADGTDPATLRVDPFGTGSNLTLKGSQVFMLGGYAGNVSGPVIKLFDFGSSTTTHLMGNTSSSGVSADRLTPGTVSTATIHGDCLDWFNCYTHYRADQDRLYFTESTSVRYITQPSTPANSTLETLWNPGSDLGPWVFSPDGTQLFYLMGESLFCHDLSSGKSWCDDSSLGPPAPLDGVGWNPNQFTWKDAGTLLMSNARGEIYQYVLPP